MIYGRPQPKEKKINLWAILSFFILFTTILITLLIGSIANKKVTRLQNNQEVILQFLENPISDRSSDNSTFSKSSSLNPGSYGISKREFDNFKQQYKKDIRKLQSDIKRLKSLL